MFNAVGGVDYDGAGFHCGQCRQGGAAEIGVARSIDQVDMTFAARDRGDAGLDRVLALFFHRIEIGDRASAFNGARRLDGAAGMQQGFKQGGFAGAGMACQCNVANGLGAVRHDLLPRLKGWAWPPTGQCGSVSAAPLRALRDRAGWSSGAAAEPGVASLLIWHCPTVSVLSWSQRLFLPLSPDPSPSCPLRTQGA
jgi:hypothetical protein